MLSSHFLRLFCRADYDRLGNGMGFLTGIRAKGLFPINPQWGKNVALEGESMDNKKTIMVVDDNPDIITIIKTILEGKGYSVISASSGPELLNLLKNQKPDLIILDIMMPEMDGLEVLTKLKGVTDTTAIPVILLTAKVQYEDVLGGYKLGADYYITKPFTSTQLINGINLLLGERKT
jgi:CheY-like chemotaxis protein